MGKAVVIGSGAGGSVAAMELARAGWEVAVFEKGPNRFSSIDGEGPIGTLFSNDDLKMNVRYFAGTDPLVFPRTWRPDAATPVQHTGAVNDLPQLVGDALACVQAPPDDLVAEHVRKGHEGGERVVAGAVQQDLLHVGTAQAREGRLDAHPVFRRKRLLLDILDADGREAGDEGPPVDPAADSRGRLTREAVPEHERLHIDPPPLLHATGIRAILGPCGKAPPSSTGVAMGMLDGKVALITGGARGQGRAHAVTCAREGADVIIADVVDQLPTVPYKLATKDDLDETVRLVRAYGRRVIAVQADVRSQEQLDAAVTAGIAELGKIDILIANAGIWTLGSFWELTDQQWDEMIGVNLTGAWKAAKAVAPHMIERRSGSIVIIASVNALEAGQYTAHYVAAKHGLIGLMRNIALELAPYGIRCNAISPGAVKTPMTNHQGAWDMFAGHPGGTEEDMTEAGHHYTLLAGTSWLDPQDVANAALYLNSDLASKVTGVTIPVDAGHLTLSGYNPVSTR